MGEQELERDHKDLADGGKRKLDAFELAKQKAQEIAARLASDAEAKRPRFVSSNSSENTGSAASNFPVPFVAQSNQYYGSQISTKKITIPNGKVGVVIGKGGETIKQIQLQSGAKVQITKDQNADPHALTRDVDVTGTEAQISRAEELINDVISEADAGSSASTAVHGVNVNQPGTEQIGVKVPNDKVGLLIGKGGETIKFMQNKSGARMQIIPLHLPPGDPTPERTVYISGSAEQIEAAKELVNDVINGKRILEPSGTSGYAQSAYASAGNWAQPAQPPAQQLHQYGYPQQPGTQPAAASYYGNYGQTWDPSNPSTMYQATHMAGYGYYGQQPPQMGSAPFDPSYGYSQGYSQQAPNYADTTSGQPDGTTSSQSTEAKPAYPPYSYGQPGANYWQAQTGYDQTGYGAQVATSSAQPAYGQPDYSQASYPLSYGQPQVQPSNNGHSQSEASGAETHDGDSNPSHDPDASKQESVPSQN